MRGCVWNISVKGWILFIIIVLLTFVNNMVLKHAVFKGDEQDVALFMMFYVFLCLSIFL